MARRIFEENQELRKKLSEMEQSSNQVKKWFFIFLFEKVEKQTQRITKCKLQTKRREISER